MLRPGDAAPDFVLPSPAGDPHRISTLHDGPIALWFYHAASNPACIIEARGFRDRKEAIEGAGARIVGISLDAPERQAAMQASHHLDYLLLSDQEGHVLDLYDAWRTMALGRTPWGVRRCSYLIDEDGIIRKAYRAVNVFGHATQVLRDLRRMQAQRSWGLQKATLKDLKP